MPSAEDDAPPVDPFTATWHDVLLGDDAVDDPAVFPDAGRQDTVRHAVPQPKAAPPRPESDAGRRVSRLVVALACVVTCVGVARAEVADTASHGPGVAAAQPSGPSVLGDAASGAAVADTPTTADGDVSGDAGTAATDDGSTPATGTPGGTVPVTGAPSDARADRAIAFALAQRGIPYVWGGDGPAEGGWDCSGLIKAAYGAADVGLPRTAQTQFDAGPHVADPANPAPGDLVFFGTPTRVHHVGLYLGNGLMVHAPHTGTVVQVGRYRWPGDDYVGASRPAAPGSAVTPGDPGAVVVPPSSSGGGSDPAPEGPAVSEPDPAPEGPAVSEPDPVVPAPPVVVVPVPAPVRVVPVPPVPAPAPSSTTVPTPPRSTRPAATLPPRPSTSPIVAPAPRLIPRVPAPAVVAPTATTTTSTTTTTTTTTTTPLPLPR